MLTDVLVLFIKQRLSSFLKLGFALLANILYAVVGRDISSEESKTWTLVKCEYSLRNNIINMFVPFCPTQCLLVEILI